ncbi:Hsp20/alpha crystallin family protein [Candidatus Wolfebacteria bacterium]|nr:Hsp20/alpha crystallin family protein [Candidatus Wolfebacteria bacterium]
MEEKNFFAKLAGVGPDGKFSNYSQKKAQQEKKVGFGNSKNGDSDQFYKKSASEELETEVDKIEDDAPEESEGQLAVDVYSTQTNFIVEAPVAGVKAEDIDIDITLDSIKIRGKRSKEDLNGEKDYIYQECFWGVFSRSITFPQEVDADRATASFKNGILRVIIPKIQRDKPKKVKVKFE